MTSTTLTGRTVLVTGASSGIGRAIAEHVGGCGAHVFLSGRSAEPLDASAEVIRASGGQADTAVFDVRDVDALQGWVAGAAEQTGALHGLVNNAGFGDMGSIIDGDPETWRGMLEVNVLAVAVAAQAAVRAMRTTGSAGHIVNISSTATMRRDSGVYGATKHAVNTINSTLREELEDDAIRVTAIIPGMFATNFTRNLDRAMVEGVAASVGMTDLPFDDQRRLPPETIAEMQSRLAPMIGDVAHIARAVEYVLLQPIEINLEELVIRPQRSLGGWSTVPHRDPESTEAP